LAETCEATQERTNGTVRKRRRPVLPGGKSLLDGNGPLLNSHPNSDPRYFDDLDDKWFWAERFRVPVPRCWAADHAAEVVQFLTSPGANKAKAVKHFRVSRPTIKHALKIAQAQRRS
jgi:hypothetical protein